MIQQHRLHALLTRHIRLHSHTLTSQQILRLIFYTWEHTLYADTLGDLLIRWTQRPDAPLDEWPAHAVESIPAHCSTFSDFRSYFPIVVAFRSHTRATSFFADIQANNSSAGGQHFNMSIEASRTAAVLKTIIALVGGIEAISMECVHREFSVET